MKKILSKQFVEQVTGLTKLNDFQKTKLKITAYYLIVSFILLNLFVGALFFIIQSESNKYQKNINIFLKEEKTIYTKDQNGLTIISLKKPQLLSINTEDFISYHKIFVDVLKIWLLKIEIILLILAGFLSYYLATLSMKPIEEKNKKQKKFLADVSHELKNPLSAIKTTLEVAQKQPDWKVGEAQEVFKDLNTEVSRLINITKDLLILESLKNNSKEKKEKVNIKEIINTIISKLTPMAQKKNIDIKADITENSKNIFAYKNDIEKIIFNILHNSIKFSKHNSIIEIKFNKEHILTIKDYGIGISKSDIEHIFDRFYKADNSRTFTKESGSGLGLSIARELAKKNNIKIKVESKKEKWTKFSLKF